jgi:CheY-like chemotaxis protein
MLDKAVTRLRVLVVDDRRDTVLLLKTIIERAGYEVATAESGDAGLKAAHDFQPHVLISDIGLGGPIDGYALVDAVRRDPAISAPRCIAVTGYEDEDHRRRARNAGFEHYLVKPSVIDPLLELLSDMQKQADSDLPAA